MCGVPKNYESWLAVEKVTATMKIGILLAHPVGLHVLVDRRNQLP